VNLEEHILIEKFLKGELSDKEHTSFSAKRANDEVFNKEVEFEENLYNSYNSDKWSFVKNNESDELDTYTALFQSAETEKLRSVLQQVNEDYKNTSKNKSNRWVIYASIAAMITLLICFLIFFNNPTSHQDLYASYLETSEVPSLVSRGEENDLIRAQSLFENGQYAKALPIFNKNLMSSNQQTSTLLLYIGISQMELNQYVESEDTFDQLINSNSLDAPKGNWFKALLYLKTGEVGKAETLLKKIKTESLYNHTKASKLLSELKEANLE